VQAGVEITNEACSGCSPTTERSWTPVSSGPSFRRDISTGVWEPCRGSFKLFDVLGSETHDFEDGNVYFTPGSTAINVLDGATGEMRVPDTADYIRYVKVTSGLKARRIAEHRFHCRRRA